MKRSPKNLLRPWPGFLRRPTLDHFFWHSHIVMTIILCQLLSLQTGHCGTAYFSHLVSSMFLCCFWLIDSFVFVRLWIGTLGDEGYRIGASPQTNTIDQDNSTAFQDD